MLHALAGVETGNKLRFIFLETGREEKGDESGQPLHRTSFEPETFLCAEFLGKCAVYIHVLKAVRGAHSRTSFQWAL